MTAISYSLTIDGEPAGSDVLGALQSIEVEDSADLASMLRLRVAIGVEPDGGEWRLIGDDLFQRLTNLRLSVTAAGEEQPLIDAYVIETAVELANDPGASVLEVVAMDSSVRLDLEEKNRPWPNASDGDIAEAIFGEHGLTPDVESTEPSRQENDVLSIQRATDMQFLRQLADRNGFECYVMVNPDTGASEGHFHPPRLDAPPQGTLSVRMGADSNVNAFTARYDMLAAASARAFGIAAADQSDQEAEIDSASLTALGTETPHGGSDPRVVLLSRTGLSETGELQTLAQAVVDRSAWAVRATGELNTAAYGGVLRARRPVNVRGAGQVLSGTYYVEKVLHNITGEGYVQRFALRRNALGLSGDERFEDDGALG